MAALMWPSCTSGHLTALSEMPAEAIGKLDHALQAWSGQYESEVYEGAHHGWTVPDNPVYNQPQAERAYKKLTELLVPRSLVACPK
jgi:carboxymethylenebutenolidase